MKYGSAKRMIKLSAAPKKKINMYNPEYPGHILQISPDQVQEYAQQGWIAPENGIITGDQLAEKPKSKDTKDKPLLGRMMQGLTGTGIATANFRTAKTLGSPDTTLYHGTSPSSAAAILGAGPDPTVTGLDTRFAGFADRLNSKMLANAFNRHLMDAGLEPSEELLSKVTQSAREEMDFARARGIQNFDSIAAIERGATNALREAGVSDAKINEVIQKARPKMQEAGKRIYLAQTPAVTSLYGSKKNEAQMAGDVFKNIATNPGAQLMNTLKTTANALTGGVLPEVSQTLKKIQYERQVGNSTAQAQSAGDVKGLMAAIRDKDSRGIENEMRRLKPDISADDIRKIQGMAQDGSLSASFGVRANRANMSSLSDFPFMSGIFSSNPGLKHEFARYVPTFDPVNDLSVPESIPLQDFRSVDLLDTNSGTPVFRFNTPNTSSAITGAERLRALRKASPYAALGLLGADMAQDAVRQKGLLTGHALRAGHQKVKSFFGGPREKTAAISRSTVEGIRESGRALKNMAIPAATVGGLGVGSAYLYDKARSALLSKLDTPEQRAAQEKYKAKLIAEGKDPRSAESAVKTLAGQTAANIVAQPAAYFGALAAPIIANPGRAYRFLKNAPMTKGDLVGAGLTAAAGATAVPLAISMSENIRAGQDLSDQGIATLPLKGTKIEEIVRDRPYLASLASYPAVMAIPVAGAYAAKKHYSGDYATLLNALKARSRV